MTIQQISVFLENAPGALAELTADLAKNNVNMRAMSLADTSDFGIARFLTDEPEKVAADLKKLDYLVNITGVIVIEIPDHAGSLNKVLKLLGENGRNIEYMYGFTGRKTNSACMIIRSTDIKKTEEVLDKAGIHMISPDELKSL